MHKIAVANAGVKLIGKKFYGQRFILAADCVSQSKNIFIQFALDQVPDSLNFNCGLNLAV